MKQLDAVLVEDPYFALPWLATAAMAWAMAA
jgi:hypothetical protein